MVVLLATLQVVGPPSFSKDWEVAFQRNSGIWVCRADGKGLSRIAAKGQDPRWSPDGKRLAYYRNGVLHVFNFATRKDASDGNVLYKPEGSWSRCFIDWDPLTRVILAAAIDGAGIQLIGAAGSILKPRSAPWVTYCPRWSPSGRELAFARNGDIWLAHRDIKQVSTQPAEYYENANRLAPLAYFNDTEVGASAATPFWVDELEWTRDEKRLVFHFQRQGGSGVSEIGYLDLAKAQDSDRNASSGFTYTDHWILGSDRMAFSPRICPDGKTLSYVSVDDDALNLYLSSWDGRQKRKVIGDVENPDWRPRSAARG